MSQGAGSLFPWPINVEIQMENGRHGGFLLVRYTDSGEFGGDTWHEGLDLAFEQAEYEYGLRPEDFSKVDD